MKILVALLLAVPLYGQLGDGGVTVYPSAGAVGPPGPAGATGGFAPTSEFNTNYIVTNIDCLTGGTQRVLLPTATTVTMPVPVAGCTIAFENDNPNSALTVNLTTNSVTGNNGNTANFVWLPACPAQPSACPSGVARSIGTNHWDFSLGAGLTGATGPAGPTGAGGVSVQSTNLGNYTGGAGTRVFGATYQNAQARTMFVVVSCHTAGAGNTQLVPFTDSTGTLTSAFTISQLIATGADEWLSGLVIVLPGNYYKIVDATSNCGGAGATGNLWFESY